MRIIITSGGLESIDELTKFLLEDQALPKEKVLEIRGEIFEEIDSLENQPYRGQKEPYLEHLNLGHRRIIYNHVKIIYKIGDGIIYVTDVFDSQKDPKEMKGE